VSPRGDQLDLGLEAPPPVGGPPADAIPSDDGRSPAGASVSTSPSSHEPSEEQRRVIDFAADLVVTAGAGSGKTRTLVDLYARILSEPGIVGAESVGPREILCLTFTERAARELQGRIRARIDDPDVLRELESAPVTTFHGWCAGVLRDHPLEAGVDPRFTVLSEEAADELLNRTVVETLRAGLESDPASRQAVELLGLREASARVAALVRDLRTAGWGRTRPIERFEERLAEMAGDLAVRLPERVGAAADALVAAARAGELTPLGRDYLGVFESALAAWRRSPDPAAEDALRDAAKKPSSSWRFGDATPFRHAVIGALDSLGAARHEIEHRFQLGVWPALAVTARDAYRSARAARRALDYDDLLLRTRALFETDQEVLASYRRRTRVVLVDEHQDTDPVQDDILRLVIGGGALGGTRSDGDPRWCLVGDSQQSIYGFRGATVQAFETMALGAAGRGARRALATNYRARGDLIAFLNAFFPGVLVGGDRADEIAYLEQHAHRAPGANACVELLDPAGLDGSSAAAHELEARAVAARIAAACRSGGPWTVTVHDSRTGEPRAARPGDVVILLRKLTQVEPYRRALDGVGLESIVVGGSGFYGRQEVFDVLSALEAALLPHEAIPLVAFLRSPMVGLPDDAIWSLLSGWSRKDGPLLPRLADPPAIADLDAGESAALAEGLAILGEIERRADRRPPAEVVAWLVDRTGYAAVLDALPDRVQRRANLDRLLTLAERAPSEGAVLLSDWIALLRRRVERPPRERDASLPEAGDRVRVMTIHQAKGLEFPVVVVADLGGRTPEGLGGVAFDPDLGVISKWWADPGAKPEATLGYRTAKESATRRERAEEARLLYVASTRARDYLLLSAGATDHWWAEATLAFAATEAGRETVRALPVQEWVARHRAGIGQSPPLAGPGIARLDPAPAAPGEATARELAAAMAGTARPAPSPWSRAHRAADEALLRGSRGHRALERIPLGRAPAPDLAGWLAGPGGLAEAEARALAPFVEREILPVLSAAATVAREHPFRLRAPGGGIVTGAIDVLWRDTDGGWWVGDYKFTEPEPDSDARHEAQLAVYALAAAAALGIDEVRGRLWYVDEGSGRDLRWDAAALAETERRVGEAFASLPAEPAEDPFREEDE